MYGRGFDNLAILLFICIGNKKPYSKLLFFKSALVQKKNSAKYKIAMLGTLYHGKDHNILISRIIRSLLSGIDKKGYFL